MWEYGTRNLRIGRDLPRAVLDLDPRRPLVGSRVPGGEYFGVCKVHADLGSRVDGPLRLGFDTLSVSGFRAFAHSLIPFSKLGCTRSIFPAYLLRSMGVRCHGGGSCLVANVIRLQDRIGKSDTFAHDGRSRRGTCSLRDLGISVYRCPQSPVRLVYWMGESKGLGSSHERTLAIPV